MSSNQCRVFAFCDQINHDDMSSCCNSMDRYYGAVVGGNQCLYCAKCQFLSHGTMRNAVFYRDHGDHLGEQTRSEKMMGIVKGIVHFLLIFIVLLIHITAQIEDMKECIEVMEDVNYGVPTKHNRDLNGNLLKLKFKIYLLFFFSNLRISSLPSNCSKEICT